MVPDKTFISMDVQEMDLLNLDRESGREDQQEESGNCLPNLFVPEDLTFWKFPIPLELHHRDDYQDNLVARQEDLVDHRVVVDIKKREPEGSLFPR